MGSLAETVRQPSHCPEEDASNHVDGYREVVDLKRLESRRRSVLSSDNNGDVDPTYPMPRMIVGKKIPKPKRGIPAQKMLKALIQTTTSLSAIQTYDMEKP